ncbi:TRAP transporter substrate-binding protein [Pseudogracilibacillus sp. SE30717A]|uniref:TRAP transporter substrate-binding protein n=1 Tax=Pseudogracilibacillus sp. SE30717A TaxID=3098293 RepID=UPI00300E5F3D
MKKVKALSLCIVSLAFLTGLFACSSNANNEEGSNSSSITLSFAYELPTDHPWGKGAEEFKKIVEEETNGEITIEIHGAGSLASSGREIQESVKVGTIDIGISSTPMSQMNPYVDIFSLPYIFNDRESAWEIIDSEIGDQVGDKLEENNIKHLAYWEDGFRQVTNSKHQIKSPKDFKGLRIRVPESDLRIETFKALGASPLPMSWSEVFTALQQGTIDGQENPLSVVDSSSFYDVQEFLTVTNHVYSPATLFINLDKWNSLTKEQQEIIEKASYVGRDLNRELNEEQDKALIKELEEKGMDVHVIEDVSEFRELTKNVWDIVIDELDEDARDIVDQIIEQQE